MTMFYFAYGSNMSTPRLRARVPSATVHGRARLPGHALRFHKSSEADGSAKCDACETAAAADEVRGVVFRIDPAERESLDLAEGLGVGYERKRVAVHLEAGDTVEAFTYYAVRIDPNLQPFLWYKEHVLRGAMEHGLPRSYIAAIRAVTARGDPWRERHRRELAIYEETPGQQDRVGLLESSR